MQEEVTRAYKNTCEIIHELTEMRYSHIPFLSIPTCYRRKFCSCCHKDVIRRVVVLGVKKLQTSLKREYDQQIHSS